MEIITALADAVEGYPSQTRWRFDEKRSLPSEDEKTLTVSVDCIPLQTSRKEVYKSTCLIDTVREALRKFRRPETASIRKWDAALASLTARLERSIPETLDRLDIELKRGVDVETRSTFTFTTQLEEQDSNLFQLSCTQSVSIDDMRFGESWRRFGVSLPADNNH